MIVGLISRNLIVETCFSALKRRTVSRELCRQRVWITVVPLSLKREQLRLRESQRGELINRVESIIRFTPRPRTRPRSLLPQPPSIPATDKLSSL